MADLADDEMALKAMGPYNATHPTGWLKWLMGWFLVGGQTRRRDACATQWMRLDDRACTRSWELGTGSSRTAMTLVSGEWFEPRRPRKWMKDAKNGKFSKLGTRYSVMGARERRKSWLKWLMGGNEMALKAMGPYNATHPTGWLKWLMGWFLVRLDDRAHPTFWLMGGDEMVLEAMGSYGATRAMGWRVLYSTGWRVLFFVL